MLKTSSIQRATTKSGSGDHALVNDADDVVGPSWLKCYAGGVKHRHYNRMEHAHQR